MTAHDVAARYYELAQQGRIHAIQDELYAPGAVSLEPENPYDLPRQVNGLEAMRAKEAAFDAYVEQVHGGHCGEPVVAAPHFACAMGMDVTMKGQPRRLKEQIGVFTVERGKIVREEFFYVDAQS